MSAVCKLSENGLFLGGRWIFLDGPHTAVRIPADVVVGIELEDAGQDAVEKVLDGQLLSFFFFLFLSAHWDTSPTREAITSTRLSPPPLLQVDKVK